jgi:hypothetical protein
VKRYEVRRSSKKPKKWRKTVACSSASGKSTVLDSSLCPKYRRFNRMICSLELPRTGLIGTDGNTRPHQNDTNLSPHLPLRAELARADIFLLAVFLVGLIRSASIGSPRVETAINHASSPNSIPLAGFLLPNTLAASNATAPRRNAQSATDACAARSEPAIRCTSSTVNAQRLRRKVASCSGAWRLIITS